jgi:hypothetical protein
MKFVADGARLMSLTEDIEGFRKDLSKIASVLEEIKHLSDNLPQCPVDQLGKQFDAIQDLCEEASQEIIRASEYLAEIGMTWGDHQLNVLTSVLVVPILREAFFTMADASEVYHSDPERKLTDLKKNPMSGGYKKPEKKMMGDLGELEVLSMLIDQDGDDSIDPHEISVKPKLPSTETKRLQHPDFYVRSRNLVIEAKAWRSWEKSGDSKFDRLKSLEAVIDKYMKLECLSQGGELRFYLPSDTYKTHEKELKDKFSASSENGVKVCFVPMKSSYDQLSKQKLPLMKMVLKTML